MLRSATLLGLALIACLPVSLLAAPRIDTVSLRGITIGETTRLTITGKQLGPEPQVHFDFPTTAIRVLPESTADRLEMEVDLPADTLAGHGHLRVASASGISAPVTLGIDRLPNGPFQETITSLPIAMTGNLAGAQLLTSTFQGKVGQRVVIEVEAQRIGSKLQPLVSIVDQRDTQLGYSSREVTAQGDARLVVDLPADGPYTIKLHDAQFRGAAPGYFRLKVGSFGFADLAFPLAIFKAEDANAVAAIGGLSDDPTITSSLAMPLPAETLMATLPVEFSGNFSGPRPSVLRSDVPEYHEVADRDPAASIGPAPLGISGILREPKERDAFLIDVTPGTKYRAEVFAQRLNSPVDAVLEIRKPDDGMLATSDDQNNTPDPATMFDVPAGVNQVKIVVHDVSYSGGDANVYRVLVTPANHADFTLTTSQPNLNVPAGGHAVLEVIAQRRGYGGPIELSFPNLPSGIEVALNEIPAKADRALVTFTASADATQSAVGPIVGKAVAGGRTIERLAAAGTSTATVGLAPLDTDLGIGVQRTPALTLAWQQPPAANALGLGQSTEVTVTATRGANQKGPVRFSLETSQVIPQDKGKPDMSKAIRIEGSPVLAADQSEMKLKIVVPEALKDIAWDVAVKGELLSDDQKQVRATASTGATRLTLGSPVFLALSGETIVRLKGNIARAGGFGEAVTVALEGLPGEAKAAPVEIAADKTEFVIEVTLPPGMKAEQLGNVRLIAKSKRNGAEVTSNEVGIRLDYGVK
ncbi:hypothetical protein AB1L30_21700 [Bremerella sp. JC817]|uniref:hypothetical protein n=1 Tax=Bremerella sp. JC817 TaxID=3231756 RepID=UPI0034583DA3